MTGRKFDIGDTVLYGYGHKATIVDYIFLRMGEGCFYVLKSPSIHDPFIRREEDLAKPETTLAEYITTHVQEEIMQHRRCGKDELQPYIEAAIKAYEEGAR